MRLAPLYDITPAFPYETHERKLKLAMKLGGDCRVSPARNTWAKAAREMGLDPGFVLARVGELTDRAADASSPRLRPTPTSWLYSGICPVGSST